MSTLLDYPKKDWKKLFQLYYAIEVSHDFLLCIDKRLTNTFEEVTKLNVQKKGIILSFQPELKLDYIEGKISSIRGTLLFRYGGYPILICWHSKSGVIYKLSDSEINCDDIEFNFENLVIQKCINLVQPKWSLFRSIDRAMTIDTFRKECDLNISESFLDCADKQLSAIFEAKTGIKINKDIILFPRSGGDFEIEEGTISKMVVTLYVNHNWNRSVIIWKAKTPYANYKTSDHTIDCSRIDFEFEDFDAVLYYQQFYPKIAFPFNIAQLSFDLSVYRLNINYTVNLYFKKDFSSEPDIVVEKIDRFIHSYNLKSEKIGRGDGIVHNWTTYTEPNKIIYEIDSGSSGIKFFKKVMRHLSEMNFFASVEVF